MTPPFSEDIVNKLLDASGRIENVISDLHYLKTGSGDVAQLDFFTRYFDAYLNRALRKMPPKGGYSAEDLDVIYQHIAGLLKETQTLSRKCPPAYRTDHRHRDKNKSIKPRTAA